MLFLVVSTPLNIPTSNEWFLHVLTDACSSLGFFFFFPISDDNSHPDGHHLGARVVRQCADAENMITGTPQPDQQSPARGRCLPVSVRPLPALFLLPCVILG